MFTGLLCKKLTVMVCLLQMLDGVAYGVTELTEIQLCLLKSKATSFRNFAVWCMRMLFTGDERRNSNIAGQRGKSKLDPTGERLHNIYDYVFRYYSLPQQDRHSIEKECRLAIDEANRNFKKFKYKDPDKKYRSKIPDVLTERMSWMDYSEDTSTMASPPAGSK